MTTRLLPPSTETYLECAAIIKNGGVVAFPTETVYGLGANAYSGEAVKKIFTAKGRPSDNPLIVHLADREDIRKIAFITPLAQKIIDAFMPGPVTVVLDKKPEICAEVTGGLDTVGVRIPENQIARDFLRACGVPVAAPSANISSRPSPTEANHVYEDLKGRIPAIIDGGKCRIGIESTVIDARGDSAVILRPGIVTADDIARVTGKASYGGNDKKALSPGTKYRHYAPSCPCIMVKSNSAEFIKVIYQKEKEKNPIIICYEATAKELYGCKTISLGETDAAAAQKLFAALRTGEKSGGIILLQACEENDKNYSLYNRMIKSCGGNIITENIPHI